MIRSDKAASPTSKLHIAAGQKYQRFYNQYWAGIQASKGTNVTF